MLLSDMVRNYILDPRYLSKDSSKTTYDTNLREYIGYVTQVLKLPNSVRSFAPDTIEGYVDYLFGRGLKSSTVNNRLSSLKGLGEYGVRTKYAGKYILAENPMSRVKRPRVNAPPERYLTLGELKALLNVDCRDNERLALACVVDQPLRATEWAEAKVKDLTIDGDTVTLTVPVKGGRYKRKVLGAAVAARLLHSLKQREAGQDESLLVNSQGKPYTRFSLSEMVNRMARRAGIKRFPVRAHVIRHSIGSAAAANGASPHEIAEILNHAGTQTVRRYVHGVKPDAALNELRRMLEN